MPANWIPIEDWLANVLQEREDVREAVVSTDGKRIELWMQDGRPFRVTIKSPALDVPGAIFPRGEIRRLGDIEEDEEENGE